MKVHRDHENHADINDRLIINLRDLSHTMRSLYEGKGSQKRILIILDEIGGSITQQKLTERLGIQPGSSSEVIAKLENAGYITRTPNEMDRRTADIALTEAGKISAAEARKQRIRRHEQMFSCLSDEEKNQLLSLLERINKDWEERYQNAADNHGCREHHHRGHRHHPRGE
ncbi:MAG TPA: MarR family transcriptional regulator [Firmicutes bacterium]|nr:MarR family transcriptional regulator [Bacillota bacterium]